VGAFSNNFEAILTGHHSLTLYSRRRHFDALFVVTIFKSHISSSMFDVSARVPAGII
jgi:hypothetical protein